MTIRLSYCVEGTWWLKDSGHVNKRHEEEMCKYGEGNDN